jgi:hypothetical protein
MLNLTKNGLGYVLGRLFLQTRPVTLIAEQLKVNLEKKSSVQNYCNMGCTDRVTGLGEFSPIGHMHTLGTYQKFLELFSAKFFIINFGNRWVWLIFFTNSSGRTGCTKSPNINVDRQSRTW